MLTDLAGWAIRRIGPVNFGIKWFAGRARPEEVAWKIATGEIDTADGVPEDLVTMIASMEIGSPYEFTAYPEGSPNHPSWPAMHSAGSAASIWLPLVLNLSEEQICQVKLLDWAISYARTVAGVHFPTDNTFGLNLGQALLAEYLPTFLAETYGMAGQTEEQHQEHIQRIQDKIESLRFDWNEFLDSECVVNSIITPASGRTATLVPYSELAVGSRVFHDRDYTFSNIGAYNENCLFTKVSNNDKNTPAANVQYSITLAGPSMVYLDFWNEHSRHTELGFSAWNSGWQVSDKPGTAFANARYGPGVVMEKFVDGPTLELFGNDGQGIGTYYAFICPANRRLEAESLTGLNRRLAIEPEELEVSAEELEAPLGA